MADEQVERGPTPIEDIDLDAQVDRHGQALGLVARALQSIDDQLGGQSAALTVILPIVAMIVVATVEERTFAEVMGDYSPPEIIDKMHSELERIFAESGAA